MARLKGSSFLGNTRTRYVHCTLYLLSDLSQTVFELFFLECAAPVRWDFLLRNYKESVSNRFKFKFYFCDFLNLLCGESPSGTPQITRQFQTTT